MNEGGKYILYILGSSLLLIFVLFLVGYIKTYVFDKGWNPFLPDHLQAKENYLTRNSDKIKEKFRKLKFWRKTE